MPRKQTPKVGVVDFTAPDIFHVANKDPKFYYRHALDDPLVVQKWKKWGFEVVTGTQSSGEEGESPANLADPADSGFVNIPGHVLMRCPKELNDKRRAHNWAKFEALKEREEDRLEEVARTIRRLGGRFGRLAETLAREE